MRIMVLHIVFKKSLALFPSVGLSDRSRYFVGFFVLKLNLVVYNTKVFGMLTRHARA
jgi:hypothetical protein